MTRCLKWRWMIPPLSTTSLLLDRTSLIMSKSQHLLSICHMLHFLRTLIVCIALQSIHCLRD